MKKVARENWLLRFSALAPYPSPWLKSRWEGEGFSRPGNPGRGGWWWGGGSKKPCHPLEVGVDFFWNNLFGDITWKLSKHDFVISAGKCPFNTHVLKTNIKLKKNIAPCSPQP